MGGSVSVSVGVLASITMEGYCFRAGQIRR